MTLGSQIRRKPNCFNLVHQLSLLMATGATLESTLLSLEAGRAKQTTSCRQSCKAHEKASAFASAYQIGKTESAAACNLLHKVPKVIRAKLTDLVRPW